MRLGTIPEYVKDLMKLANYEELEVIVKLIDVDYNIDNLTINELKCFNQLFDRYLDTLE